MGYNDIIKSSIISLVIIIPVTKRRKIRWAGHVAHMGKKRSAFKISDRQHEAKGTSENLGEGRRITQKCTRKKQHEIMSGCMWLEIRINGHSSEKGNESSGPITCRENS
jgi:hypothetical protein